MQPRNCWDSGTEWRESRCVGTTVSPTFWDFDGLSTFHLSMRVPFIDLLIHIFIVLKRLVSSFSFSLSLCLSNVTQHPPPGHPAFPEINVCEWRKMEARGRKSGRVDCPALSASFLLFPSSIFHVNLWICRMRSVCSILCLLSDRLYIVIFLHYTNHYIHYHLFAVLLRHLPA